MRDDTTASDRRFDQAVQLLVSSDGQLQMAGSDTLHLQVLGRVAGQLQYLMIVVERESRESLIKRSQLLLVQSPAARGSGVCFRKATSNLLASPQDEN